LVFCATGDAVSIEQVLLGFAGADGSQRSQIAEPSDFSLGTLLMTEWYLVWIEGPRGPEPQKWSSEGLWGQLGRQDVIVRFALTDQEAKLSLDQLAREHPVPLK
jgi:hypothetical protein